MRKFLLSACLVLVVGCGPDADYSLSDESADDGLELVESELNADVLLKFVNSKDATYLVLWQEAKVDPRAARRIFEKVFGVDETYATADDARIGSISELDAIPYVGPGALARLDVFATARFGVGSANIEGVLFSATEAKDAIAVANSAQLDAVGLTSGARSGIIAARPLSTLAQLGAAAQVGPVALTRIRDYARANVVGGPTVCTGGGGSYDGVAFTAAEECHAVSFLNQARFSEMALMPEGSRSIAYEGSPDGLIGHRVSKWSNLTQFSTKPGIGAVAMNGLKQAAAAWTRNGLTYDTVAATWTNRAALNGKPVLFEKVFITKRLPDRGSSSWYTWQCAEFRDSPTATNFIAGCYQIIGADSAPECGNGGCLDGKEGTWVSLRGNFFSTAHGWRINLSHRRLGEPSPNVP